jgi:hypothetical protein
VSIPFLPSPFSCPLPFLHPTAPATNAALHLTKQRPGMMPRVILHLDSICMTRYRPGAVLHALPCPDTLTR